MLWSLLLQLVLTSDYYFLLWRKSLGLVSLVGFIVFNATFNNISAISWRSVLLVEETGVPGKNQRSVTSLSHWQTLSHIMLYRVYLAMLGKDNYHIWNESEHQRKRLVHIHWSLTCAFHVTERSVIAMLIHHIQFNY